MQNRVLAIHRQLEKGHQPELIECGEFSTSWGLKEDCHGSQGQRQVSFFSQTVRSKIENISKKGFCMVKFIENITIDDSSKLKLKNGTILVIGNTIHRVTKIGKECFSDCPAYSKNENCIMLSGVFFTEVIQDGTICVGDIVEVKK